MKNILLLCIAILGITINVYPQINLDVNGNFNNNNFKITSEKFITNSANTIFNPPVIIHTIKSPTSSPDDIAFDGVNLWVAGYGINIFYKISPVDGSIIKTLPTNITRPHGLEFANGFLWVADADHKLIQQVDTSFGNVISSFPTPSNYLTSYPQGLAWDGQNLWLNDAMATSGNLYDSTYQISTAGQIIQSHHAFGTYVTGLAWDGQFLWSTDNISLNIYKIDVSTFTVVDSIDAPGGQYPNGLAFDGQYLWVVNGDADSLYQIDISNTNTGLSHYASTNSLDFSIYPNPSTNEITINLFNSEAASSYSIIDQTGRQIMNGILSDPTTKIDISQLTAGIYLFQIDGKRVRSFEVIKK